jgi:NAD/NADP transhydrogenase beta subunit
MQRSRPAGTAPTASPPNDGFIIAEPARQEQARQVQPAVRQSILEVERARSIIVLKRSMRPGFAGVDNDLYYNEKCMMLFGDAKESMTKVIGEMKSLI